MLLDRDGADAGQVCPDKIFLYICIVHFVTGQVTRYRLVTIL